MPKSKINLPRLLLAKVRDGDFAHAGDKEAIDIVLNKTKQLIKKNPTEKKEALDAGCGLGGTACAFQDSGFDVNGIDSDAAAIEHAKKHYPHIPFIEGDILKIAEIFPKKHFSLIYLFNVFYALKERQRESLHHLAKIAKPGAILVIFDYTHRNLDKPHGLIDLAGTPMAPIVPGLLHKWLEETGWEIVEETDLSPQFKQWYSDFLIKFENKREELLQQFTQEAFDKVYDTFSQLLKQLNAEIIGGTAVYARRTNQNPSSFFATNCEGKQTVSPTGVISTHIKANL